MVSKKLEKAWMTLEGFLKSNLTVYAQCQAYQVEDIIKSEQKRRAHLLAKKIVTNAEEIKAMQNELSDIFFDHSVDAAFRDSEHISEHQIRDALKIRIEQKGW